MNVTVLMLVACDCHRPGTIGSLGLCDMIDGQCACKPHVGGTRICDQCQDGFFGLSAADAFGCQPCACDVGGTSMRFGEGVTCDKNSGQCMCKKGMEGRRYEILREKGVLTMTRISSCIGATRSRTSSTCPLCTSSSMK